VEVPIAFTEVSWPSSVAGSGFPRFLNNVERIMESKPRDSKDGIEIDHTQIDIDITHFSNFHTNKTMTDRLKLFIIYKQTFLKTGLTADRLAGFEEFPRFDQLRAMATGGLQPFLKPDFVPNRGAGDFRRDAQSRRLRHTIAQHVRKLQDSGRCVLLTKATVDGVEGVHVSALHVALKEADTKGRPCVDATHSGLNGGTDLEALTAYLGVFRLPQLRALAGLLSQAERTGQSLVHKTDVTAAFNNMWLSPAAALLQMIQIGDYVLIPLVAGFGWSAAPAYYNVIADAINWAHNGNVPAAVLDDWARVQDREPPGRPPDKDNTARSLTYVDDSFGNSSTVSVASDMGDLETIITRLLGPEAYNVKKTEGPADLMTIIGWECDMVSHTIRPGAKGRCKMYYWVFRGLDPDKFLSLHDLQRAVGTLRWYSAIVPLSSTTELQAFLNTLATDSGNGRLLYRKLSKPAVRELSWWRWFLTVNLESGGLEMPIWFLAQDQRGRTHHHMYTDASTLIGGGYYIPDLSFSQFRWSDTEKAMYGRGSKTDINGLEFVTAVLAIITERESLRGCVVHLHVDNTAAVTWLNKQRTSQLFGQSWIRLLVSVMLEYDILIDCIHIQGTLNVIADALSRYLQIPELELLRRRCTERRVLSQAYREHIWSMSPTEHYAKEYLAVLRGLERQDSEHSSA
jgi:hypothetical protein